MTTANMPGRNSHATAYVNTHRVTLPYCSGGCQQGHAACDCDTELANTAPLRPKSCVLVRPAITVHRISRRRRARRFVRALFQFLTASRIDLL